MQYTDQFRLSRHVRISIPITPVHVNNLYAKYWTSITSVVFGSNDIRARIGTFTNPWGAKSCDLFKPPPFNFINTSLSDLLDQRAIEINLQANKSHKRIALMWSGGIDSTTVLSAFIKNSTQEQLSNITVVLTPSSILENFNFYKNFIYEKFECVSYHTIDITNEFLDNNILIHGDPGDCLFGPSLSMYEPMLQDRSHLKPWKDNLHNIVEYIDRKANQNKIPNGFAQWYADKITNNLLETQPPGVESVADWWWWHYYNFKWEFSVWRPFFKMRSNLQDPISNTNIESLVTNTFFNTDAFQQWSYSNLKTHVGSSKQDHKMQAKKYIFELDADSIYFNNKIKVDSGPKNWEHRVHPMYYDTNWVGHYLYEPGVKDTAMQLLEDFQG